MIRPLVTERCCQCKMEFGMPDHFHRTAQEMKEKLTFYCPAGHPQHYVTGDSEEVKLRRERDRLKQSLAMWQDDAKSAHDRADANQRSAAAYKGVATRMKNRAKRGVCPCCNRSFENLRRHMETKHPGELAEMVEKGQETSA